MVRDSYSKRKRRADKKRKGHRRKKHADKMLKENTLWNDPSKTDEEK